MAFWTIPLPGIMQSRRKDVSLRDLKWVNSGGNTTEVDYPIVAPGDVIVAILAHRGNGASFTPPSGWSTVDRAWNVQLQTAIASKIATGSETGTAIFSWGSSATSQGILMSFQNAEGVEFGQNVNGTSVSKAFTNGGYLLAGFASPIATQTMTSGPAGMVRLDSLPDSDPRLRAFGQEDVPPGSVTKSITWTNATNARSCLLKVY